MSERREVRGWVVADFPAHRGIFLTRGQVRADDAPVVIRHADDDAALLVELERLRKLTDHESDQ